MAFGGVGENSDCNKDGGEVEVAHFYFHQVGREEESCVVDYLAAGESKEYAQYYVFMTLCLPDSMDSLSLAPDKFLFLFLLFS